MYKMLVVDDDRSEREGVKFLTEQFNWELEIAEADCGEAALEYIRDSGNIDMMLTDIRMRELDGLQLAQKVKELSPHTKIIFMSAYGEFEYAQKAIDLKVIHYILKPVEIGEFMRVVSGVIEMCDEERRQKKQNERIQEVYWKGIRYEKQKFLYDIIHGRGAAAEEDREGTVIHFSGYRYVRMAMMHAGTRFFDTIELDAVESILEGATGGKADLVNLNEVQSVLLYEGKPEETEGDLIQMGTFLAGWFKDHYHVDVTIVISGLIENLGQISSEFNQMETMLANTFFMERGAVLYSGEVGSGGRDISLYTRNVLLDMVEWLKEIEVESDKIVLLIEMLQGGKTVSENYVKYVCTELLKSIIGRPTEQNVNGYMMSLERIYHASSLRALLEAMQSIAGDSVSDADRPQELLRRVIEDVVQMIDREYSSEITLESIAGRVYLSPGYLSRLFKKYKGKSIIKHITAIRLEKAGELLLTTNKKITDIGKEVGYPNFAYFSALFKNNYGKTPSQYREEHGL